MSFTNGRPCSFVLEGGALLLLSIPRDVEVVEVVEEVEACCSVASSMKRRRRNDLQIENEKNMINQAHDSDDIQDFNQIKFQ